jgi:hypothetical protein
MKLRAAMFFSCYSRTAAHLALAQDRSGAGALLINASPRFPPSSALVPASVMQDRVSPMPPTLLSRLSANRPPKSALPHSYIDCSPRGLLGGATASDG